MNFDTDNCSGPGAGLPFVRPIVRKIIEQLFREQSQWKSGDLVDRIVQVHRAQGGSAASNPGTTVRRVLQDLRDEGLVTAPGHGWWRWNGTATDAGPIPAEVRTDATILVDEGSDGFDNAIPIEKEIEAGCECVYLYFNPNDRRLAELEGRDVWECKIGRTSSCDAISRILGQGTRTALSRLPTVGLVLRTDDSAAIEKALHASLRLVDAEVPESPGNEWFITSPARVEAWYTSFRNSLAILRASSTPTG